MKIVAQYDFNGGKREVLTRYATELAEITQAIHAIHAADFKTKVSEEKTMHGRMLYSPSGINKAFKQQLEPRGWRNPWILSSQDASSA